MVQVSEQSLKEIGETAAREIMGAGVEEVEVKASLDHAGEPAYFFTFLVEQEGEARRAALKRARLGRKIPAILSLCPVGFS
jgi:hypothetical protein